MYNSAMCLQIKVGENEVATSPGKLVPVVLPGGGQIELPLSKSAFAKEEHLWRAGGLLPFIDQAEAFAAARTKVTRKHGDGAQVFWLHSAFGRGYIPNVSRFAEKNPGFDEDRPVNEELNPFFLWFDAPDDGRVMPVVISVDTFRWNDKKQDGLRVVANILTRKSGGIVPVEIHDREPYFQHPQKWLAYATRAVGG
jgi:hypothetical protein